MDWKKAKRMAKAIGKGLVEGIDKGLDNMARIRQEYDAIEKRARTPVSFHTGDEIILTEDMVYELKWMTPGKLRAIFAGKKVRIDGKPGTFYEMKWMKEDQLKAIFGEGRGNG